MQQHTPYISYQLKTVVTHMFEQFINLYSVVFFFFLVEPAEICSMQSCKCCCARKIEKDDEGSSNEPIESTHCVGEMWVTSA